jgi:protein-tyrosine phosphatase
MVQRVIPLAGGRNFRDLGGYTTTDGHRVRWGRVFRSGVMSYLTDHDHDYLRPMGIRTICDFRTLRERRREPIRWGSAHPDILEWDYDAHGVSLRADLTGTDFSPEIARSTMCTLYRRIPILFRTQYAALFDRLACGYLPLVFNCSAGKDRTGMAAALLLSSLGVPREQIMADYVLTDSVVDLEKEMFAHSKGSVALGDDHSYLQSVGHESRTPLLKALPEYLDAGFDQIEMDHGSVADFIRDVLGVSGEKLLRLRDHLLEA